MSGYQPHSTPPGAAASPKRLTNVAYLQFATETPGLRTQTAIQPNFIPLIFSPRQHKP